VERAEAEVAAASLLELDAFTDDREQVRFAPHALDRLLRDHRAGSEAAGSVPLALPVTARQSNAVCVRQTSGDRNPVIARSTVG
jgi:hypothetical protein